MSGKEFGRFLMSPIQHIIVAGVLILATANVTTARRYPLTHMPDLHGKVIRDLVQDTDGHIWVATTTGLWRSSDRTFKPAFEQSLGSRLITRLAIARDDQLWIGTIGDIFLVDTRRVKIVRQFSDIGRQAVRSFELRPDGELWVGTERGIYVGDGKGPFELQKGTDRYQVSALAFDADGTLWGGSGRALLRIRDGQIEELFPDIVRPGRIERVITTNDGSVWFGLRNPGGLYRLREGQLKRYTSDDGIHNDEINELIETPNGDIWIATEAGAVRWDGNSFTTVDQTSGLENSDVHALLIDHEDHVWIGTFYGGLYRLSSMDVLHYPNPPGLAHPVVSDIAFDGSGQLIIASFAGTATLDPEVGTIIPASPAMPSEQVFALRNGQVWLRWFHRYAPLGDDVFNTNGLQVNYVTTAPSGNALVATKNGAYELNADDEVVRRLELIGLPDRACNIIHCTQDGTIYVGTRSGLHRCTNNRCETIFDECQVLSMFLESHHHLLLGTNEGLLEYRSGTISRYPPHVVNRKAMRKIVKDRRGRYWIAGERGLFRLENNELTLFTHEDGLPSSDVKGVAISPAGTLWLGTTSGIASIRPEQLSELQPNKPQLDIKHVIAGGRALTPTELPANLSIVGEQIEFEMECVGWRSCEDFRFQHNVEGLTDFWSPPTDQTSIRFDSLLPGKYVFKARAVDAYGNVGGSARDIPFTIVDASSPNKTVVITCVLLCVAAVLFVWWRRVLDQRSAVRAAKEKFVSDEQFRFVFDSGPIGMALVNLDHQFIKVNRAYTEIVGYTEEELRSKTFYDITHPDDLKRNIEIVSPLFEGNARTEVFEKRYVTKEGQPKWVSIRTTVVHDESDKPVFCVAMIEDIDEKRTAEIERENSERRLRTIINTVPSMIYVKNAEGRFLAANDATAQCLGRTVEQVVGELHIDLHSDPEEVKVMLEEDRKVLQTGEQFFSAQDSFHDAHGSIRWLQTIKVPYHDGGFGEPAVLGISMDVTELREAEAALRDTNLRFTQISENLDDIFWYGDAADPESFRAVYVSPAYEKIFQRPVQDLFDDAFAWLRAVHDDDRDRVAASFTKFIRGEGEFDEEYRILRPDGTQRNIAVRGTRIVDKELGIVRVGGITRDITHRKSADAEIQRAHDELARNVAALRETNLRFSQMCETIDDIIWYGDAAEPDHFELAYVSPSFERIFQRSVEEFYQEPYLWLHVTHDDDKERMARAFRSFIHGERNFDEEHRIIRPDGTQRIIAVRGTRIEDKEHGVLRVGGVGRDVTFRKADEDEIRRAHNSLAETVADLRETNLRFLQVSESIDDIFWLADAENPQDYRILYINPAFERILGLSTTSLYEDPYAWAKVIPEDDRERVVSTFQRFLRGEDSFDIEWRIIRPDGHERFLSCRAELIRDENNRVIRAAGIVSDITAWKEVETEIRRARDELADRVAARTADLQQANQKLQKEIAERRLAEEKAAKRRDALAHVSRLSLMGEMASGLAHELNQPLTAIINYAQGCVRMLQQQAHDKSALEHAMTQAAQQATRAGEIITRMRDFAKADPTHRIHTTINTAITNAIDFTKFDLDKRSISLERRLADDLPNVFIDSVQIEQVVLNLIRNAADALADVHLQQRRILVTSTRSDEHGVLVTVADNGPGVAQEAQDRLFHPFFTTKPDGMGLGLSISQSIVETHGGRMWHRSSGDGWTLFSFTIPPPPQETVASTSRPSQTADQTPCGDS